MYVSPCATVWCQVLLPCTAGRVRSRCHSHQSSVCVCGRNCPFFHARTFLLPLHATFSAQRGWIFHNWTTGSEITNWLIQAECCSPKWENIWFKVNMHSPWPWPHIAETCTSVWFCLGLRTSSCLCKSHTEHSPLSFCRAHTPRTFLQTVSPKNVKQWV